MINNMEKKEEEKKHKITTNADETQTTIEFINGDKAIIYMLSFEEAEELKNAILGVVPNINISQIETSWIGILCGIESNKNYNQCLKKCLSRCSYNNVSIDKDTFNTKKARENYYTIVIEILKMNIQPFLMGLPFLSSMLKNIQTLKNQEQKSE